MSRSWVEIDLDAVRHNVRVLAHSLSPSTEILAVVKANAYGHGAIPCAKAALEAGATRLAVATAEEALELRKHGLQAPILVLGAFDPTYAEAYPVHNLTASLSDPESARLLAEAARRARGQVSVHLHVDTGMTRLGIPAKKAEFLAHQIFVSDFLSLDGVSTHLATADEAATAFASLQLARFREVLDRLRKEGLPTGTVHVANTAAILRFGPEVEYQAIRPGLGLYGIPPAKDLASAANLAPALSWKTRVVRNERVPAGTFVSYGRTHQTTHPVRILTLPVGYADGYPRILSNRAEVLIRGRRLPVVGQVTMDHLMVEAPDSFPVPVGEPVTLLGQDQGSRISALELADKAETIPYEITARIGTRIQRRYVGASQVRRGHLRRLA